MSNETTNMLTELQKSTIAAGFEYLLDELYEVLPFQYGAIASALNACKNNEANDNDIDEVKEVISFLHDKELVSTKYKQLGNSITVAVVREYLIELVNKRILEAKSQLSILELLNKLENDDIRRDYILDSYITQEDLQEIKRIAGDRLKRDFDKSLTRPKFYPEGESLDAKKQELKQDNNELGEDELTARADKYFEEKYNAAMAEYNNKKQEYYASEAYEEARNNLVAEGVSEKVEEYMLALRIKNSSPDEAEGLIKKHKEEEAERLAAARLRLAGEQADQRLGKEKNTEDYFLVRVGVLTADQAILFNYHELNTYQAVFGENESEIRKLFKYAIYKGQLEDLAQINHTKIFDILCHQNLFDAILKGAPSLKRLSEYDRDELGQLAKLSDYLSQEDFVEVLADENFNYKVNLAFLKATEDGNLPADYSVDDVHPKVIQERLVIAARNGKWDIVKELIANEQAFAKITSLDQAISYAASNGELEIVKELIANEQAFAKITSLDQAIINAARNGKLEIVKELITNEQAFAKITSLDRAIINAAIYGKLEIVKELIANEKAFAKITADVLDQAIINAVSDGKWDIVKELIANEQVLAKITSLDRAIINAAMNGKLEIVKELIANEQALAKITSLDKAIINTAIYGKREIVKELIANEQALAKITANGLDKAISYAAGNGKWEIVKELIANEQALAKITANGLDKAISYAAGSGKLEIVKELIANKNALAKININNPIKANGLTLFYNASQHKDSVGLLQSLLDAGADINKGLYDSFTPLMVAALLGQKDNVEFLLKHLSPDQIAKSCDKDRAEKYCRDKNIEMPPEHNALLGKTASEMATDAGHIEISTMIKEAMQSVKVSTTISVESVCAGAIELNAKAASESKLSRHSSQITNTNDVSLAKGHVAGLAAMFESQHRQR